MRELKFRALSVIVDGSTIPTYEWLYYSTAARRPCSLNLIDLETEGQYTGLKDKGGKDIFTGDILLLDLISGDRVSEVKICELREIPVVKYFEDEEVWAPLHNYVGKPDTCLQVIGNIHENPELL